MPEHKVIASTLENPNMTEGKAWRRAITVWVVGVCATVLAVALLLRPDHYSRLGDSTFMINSRTGEVTKIIVPKSDQ
jgi:hypothetical protein